MKFCDKLSLCNEIGGKSRATAAAMQLSIKLSARRLFSSTNALRCDSIRSIRDSKTNRVLTVYLIDQNDVDEFPLRNCATTEVSTSIVKSQNVSSNRIVLIRLCDDKSSTRSSSESLTSLNVARAMKLMSK
jgi:hypothetical protein